MKNVRDWQQNTGWWKQLLKESTGEDVNVWNARVESMNFRDETSLRTWLTEQGVTGYAQTLLVMEHFGYPDFLRASADELIEGQYADRPHLRPIFDTLINAVLAYEQVAIQVRKTYVSLVGPRRTFARIVPTTKNRVDLGLRLDGQQPTGRLVPSTIHETMKVQIGLAGVEEIDDEVLEWLRRAYETSGVPTA